MRRCFLAFCFVLASLLTPLAQAEAVNINTASAQELDQALDGIGLVLSRRIVEYRSIHGPFRQPEDLQNVPYVGIKTFQKNRHRIRVQD